MLDAVTGKYPAQIVCVDFVTITPDPDRNVVVRVLVHSRSRLAEACASESGQLAFSTLRL